MRCSTTGASIGQPSGDDKQHQDTSSAPPGGENEMCAPPGGEWLNGEMEDEVKEQVFDAAMHYVPKYGWSRRAIAAGEEIHILNRFYNMVASGGSRIS